MKICSHRKPTRETQSRKLVIAARRILPLNFVAYPYPYPYPYLSGSLLITFQIFTPPQGKGTPEYDHVILRPY